MSEPFVQTSTPAIERANRLLSLRSNPGFRDAWHISNNMALEAQRISSGYPGWDPNQMIVLNARAKAAQEHHEMFFANIMEAIRVGVEEQKLNMHLDQKTPAEAIEQGDYVRQQVLQKFEEMDTDNRPAGSY